MIASGSDRVPDSAIPLTVNSHLIDASVLCVTNPHQDAVCRTLDRIFPRTPTVKTEDFPRGKKGDDHKDVPKKDSRADLGEQVKKAWVIFLAEA